MYDASNRKDIREAEKNSRAAERVRIQYLQATMSHTAGRAWIWELLEFCHLFSDPFTGDSLTEAYRKGERNVGLRIFADVIAHCPDDYIHMVKEENGRRTLLDTVRNRRTDPGSAPERSSSEDPGWDAEGRLDGDIYADASSDT